MVGELLKTTIHIRWWHRLCPVLLRITLKRKAGLNFIPNNFKHTTTIDIYEKGS